VVTQIRLIGDQYRKVYFNGAYYFLSSRYYGIWDGLVFQGWPPIARKVLPW